MNLDGYTVTNVIDLAARYRMAVTEGLGYSIPPVLLLPSNVLPGAIAVLMPEGAVPHDDASSRVLWRARGLVGLPQPLCEDCFASARTERRRVREACEHVDHEAPS